MVNGWLAVKPGPTGMPPTDWTRNAGWGTGVCLSSGDDRPDANVLDLGCSSLDVKAEAVLNRPDRIIDLRVSVTGEPEGDQLFQVGRGYLAPVLAVLPCLDAVRGRL